eukprot:GHVS01090390.1.p1 GENE.GHVS01090390.1~~GHVS01090390.1.p1  ORF type:complete len:170 (+),score=12.25 GHVS01090390.1:835-1344(+)
MVSPCHKVSDVQIFLELFLLQDHCVSRPPSCAPPVLCRRFFLEANKRTSLVSPCRRMRTAPVQDSTTTFKDECIVFSLDLEDDVSLPYPGRRSGYLGVPRCLSNGLDFLWDPERLPSSRPDRPTLDQSGQKKEHFHPPLNCRGAMKIQKDLAHPANTPKRVFQVQSSNP